MAQISSLFAAMRSRVTPSLQVSRALPLTTVRGAGGVSCMMARLVTLLPEPDSPTSAKVSPGRTKKETSCTAGIVVSPRRKATLMFSTVRVGAAAEFGFMSRIEPGVQRVAQTVADEVEARDRKGDGDS